MHIITSFNTGGAEAMTLKLLQTLNPTVKSCVIVLMERGTLSAQLDALNIPVYYLGIKQGGLPSLNAVWKLVSIARKLSPDVVQGWMYHGNLAACLVKIILGKQPGLIWNIRQTLSTSNQENYLTGWIIKISASLSKMPSKIIYNSLVSVAQHGEIGFENRNHLVIPNGFDLDVFKPDAKKKQHLRKKLGVSPNVKLIGHVARFHPMKDHNSMLRAAREVLNKRRDVCFVFAGWKIDMHNLEVMQLIQGLNLEEHVILLGERSNPAQIMASLDFFVSSSAWGEGFPNVVGEAMATGVPCVVTDVGDSSHVVGEFGSVVKPANSSALAHSMLEMLEHSPKAYKDLSVGSRERVASIFSLQQVGDTYLNLYKSVAMD